MVRRKRLLAIPSEDHPRKVSLKIDFDDPVAEGEWHGHRKLSLENGQGGSLLAEGLAWQLMARAGVIAGRSSWVRLHVNGAPAGVYVRVEQIDKSFLRRRVGDDESFLYKLTRRETREGENDPFTAALCYTPFRASGVAECPAPAGYAGLDGLCDLQQLLGMAAVDAFLVNWDSLFGLGNNYWWYSSDRPRLYFPWDLDASLRADALGDPHDLLPERDVDFEGLLANAGLRAAFDRNLLRLAADPFHPDAIDRLLAELSPAIGPAIDADPWNDLPHGFAAEVERIRSWVRSRSQSIGAYLPPPDPSPVVLNEILAANTASSVDEHGQSADWVELHNRGTTAVVLQGFHLSDDPAAPRKWPVPEVTLPAGGYLLVWCDGDVDEGPLHAGFRLEAEGEAVGLYQVAGESYRTVDFAWFGPQTADVALGRYPDGTPGFRALPCPSPGGPNEDGACPGGRRFRRGDVSPDGDLDLADAILLLNGLFLGARLECLDAADGDDDGVPTLRDAVIILLHLFRSGPPPAEPFPGCGADPSPDRLGCARYASCD
jgi:hypothetical protein